MFSKIPRDEIKTNKDHILHYTIIPAIVTFGYLILLFAKHSGGNP